AVRSGNRGPFAQSFLDDGQSVVHLVQQRRVRLDDISRSIDVRSENLVKLSSDFGEDFWVTAELMEHVADGVCGGIVTSKNNGLNLAGHHLQELWADTGDLPITILL